MDAHHERVKARFNKWQLCRASLREKSLLLDEAMGSSVEGAAPMPAELIAEVKALREECDALFKHVLEAMSDQTRAQENNRR